MGENHFYTESTLMNESDKFTRPTAAPPDLRLTGRTSEVVDVISAVALAVGRPDVLGAAIVDRSGVAVEQLNIAEERLEQQTYAMLLAERIGEELGFRDLRELRIEGDSERVQVLKRKNGCTFHVAGSEHLSFRELVELEETNR